MSAIGRSRTRLARQIADNAPRGELKSYPCAHFDFYCPDVRAPVVADQIAFLRKQVMVHAPIRSPQRSQ
jgi:hypothetical protein